MSISRLIQRQPVFRGGLQDLEVLPGVPRPIRLHRGRTGVLRRVLRALQPRPPTLGHRPPHPGLGPLREGHRDQEPAPRDADCRLRCQPHPVPASPARCTATARGGVDQPTSRSRGGCTELVNQECLKSLDRFRARIDRRDRNSGVLQSSRDDAFQSRRISTARQSWRSAFGQIGTMATASSEIDRHGPSSGGRV